MKTSLLAFVVLFSASLGLAQPAFPGLKNVLTAAEWQRAGLDRLTPDELGVIDAAIIRYNGRTTAQLQADLAAAKQAQVVVQQNSVAVASTPGAATAPKGWMERFGLPVFNDSDWRAMPPLKAKVVKWDGGNRFVLDNGQVWEGFQAITYELPGKNIEIQARPHGQFALVVEGVNTTLRVMRLR
ncbi:hypothetical protein [Oleiharenicola lentus]|uniref:hypothetical protein n=1 Tax=Oleiharenicola lentus TaxID=2508720 RepID=UPI003F673093